MSNLTPEAKVTKAQSIFNAMQASGNFSNGSLPVSYGNLQAAIDNLSAAITAANSINASSADTSHMHEQERLLTGLFTIIRSHIEYEANQTADPGTMITSAGMVASTSGGLNAVNELTLDARGGGKVQIRIPRGEGEKAFIFETSTDGVTWAWAASSTLSKIVLSGLTPLSTVYVRYYGISKNGNGETSQPKSIIVL
jgi:hypothetical protein